MHVGINIKSESTMSSKKGGSLKYFSDDATGFKIQPKTVLIMSLVYIGIVVLLHIYSKVTTVPVAKPETTEGSETAGEANQEANSEENKKYTEETL